MQEKDLIDELNHLEDEEKRMNIEIKELTQKASNVNEEGDALYRELRSNHRYAC